MPKKHRNIFDKNAKNPETRRLYRSDEAKIFQKSWREYEKIRECK